MKQSTDEAFLEVVARIAAELEQEGIDLPLDRGASNTVEAEAATRAVERFEKSFRQRVGEAARA